ncbi:MAG: hypothetical protein P4L33_04765, partial [Capsulimonadaceae bacterium]|nr:hypothetical protein [Capsulimonadaceae bacterium]
LNLSVVRAFGDLSTPSEWGPLLSETERLLAALPSAPKLLPLRLLGLARTPEPVEGEEGANEMGR